MNKIKIGKSQQEVLDYLRDSDITKQLTTEEIAREIGWTETRTKHALVRLHANGLVLRAQGRPAKWSAAPQVVETPPAPYTAPLHGSMPQA